MVLAYRAAWLSKHHYSRRRRVHRQPAACAPTHSREQGTMRLSASLGIPADCLNSCRANAGASDSSNASSPTTSDLSHWSPPFGIAAFCHNARGAQSNRRVIESNSVDVFSPGHTYRSDSSLARVRFAE
jgi:hypothetical protein